MNHLWNNSDEKKMDQWEIDKEKRMSRASDILSKNGGGKYIKIDSLSEIDAANIESGDIITLAFKTPDRKNLLLKCFVIVAHSKKARWYVTITDDFGNELLGAMEKEMAFPIIMRWNRRLEIPSIQELLPHHFQHLHESKISEIMVFKKPGNTKWVSSIGWLLKSKILNLFQ